MAKRQLAELADVSYGRPVSRYERAGSDADSTPKRRRKTAAEPQYEWVRVLTVSSLSAWPDSLNQLDKREIDVTRTEFFAHEGDVVVALSYPFPAICITAADISEAPLFIPNSCAVIRCKEELDPWYLTGYLGLDIVRNAVLPGQSRGDRTVLLSAKQLGEATIDVPSLEAQGALAHLVRQKVKLEIARRRADEADRKCMEAAFSRAIKGADRV